MVIIKKGGNFTSETYELGFVLRCLRRLVRGIGNDLGSEV